jgi:hypothetical protein
VYINTVSYVTDVGISGLVLWSLQYIYFVLRTVWISMHNEHHKNRLITGFIARFTRRVLPVEQELPTPLEHLNSPPVFSGVRVTRSLVLCVCFVNRCLSFCTFLLAIVLSVLLRYTDSDYLPLVSSNSSYTKCKRSNIRKCWR